MELAAILPKTDCDESGDLWLTDGLLFANVMQDYGEGVNPLSLQWKDSYSSLFAQKKSEDGNITVSLRLDEERGWMTAEELAVPMTSACETLFQLAQGEYRLNRNYLVDVWASERNATQVQNPEQDMNVDEAMVSTNHDTEDETQLFMSHFDVIKASNKTLPD